MLILLKGDHQSLLILKRDRIITIDDENVAGVNLKNECTQKVKGVVGSRSNCILKPDKKIEKKT